MMEQKKQKTVSESRLQTAQIMTPADTNILGKVFGGSILSMIDLHASATAGQFSGTTCVTASFDRVDFHEPIEVGELVTLVGYVSYVGRTSMEITIEGTAQNLRSGAVRQTNTARVTMVALGKDGRPTEVPRLMCETREDKIRFLEGKLRRELRESRRHEFEKWLAFFKEASEDKLETLLQAEHLKHMTLTTGTE